MLPGRFIRTQAEVDDVSLGKVAAVTDADRAIMIRDKIVGTVEW